MNDIPYSTLDILKEDIRLYGETHDCYVFYKPIETGGLLFEIHLMPDEIEDKDLMDPHLTMPLNLAYQLFHAQSQRP